MLNSTIRQGKKEVQLKTPRSRHVGTRSLLEPDFHLLVFTPSPGPLSVGSESSPFGSDLDLVTLRRTVGPGGVLMLVK